MNRKGGPADLSNSNCGYHRPTDKWRCGAEQTCPFGPDHNGQCRHSDSACVPVTAERQAKFRLGLGLTLIGITLLLVFLSSKSFLTFISPGPLSVGHAEVGSCKDCHAAIGDNVVSWVHNAIRLNGGNDDQMCLTCHEMGNDAFSPHSTSASNLPSKTDVELAADTNGGLGMSWKMSMAKKLNKFDAAGDDSISCSSCHREHKGQLESLDTISAEQCHSCHQVTFGAIESQHPEYSQFPHTVSTAIKFDHVSHLEKYFYEDEYFDLAPEGCQQCHAPDRSGEWMLSRSFEETCSDCHLSEVLGGNRADAKGVAFLAIPELDTDALSRNGWNIGEWPKWADGEMTPFMLELLSRETHSTPKKLYDLSDSTEQELQATAELAWSIKELLYDIQMGGTKVVSDRIEHALGAEFDQSIINKLVASLPRDTLTNNQKDWFPSLLDEVIQYRQGQISLKSEPPKQKPISMDTSLSSDDELVSDDTVQQDEILIDDSDILSDDSDILSDDSDILSDDSDILSDDLDILSDDLDILSDDLDILSDDSDILSDDSDILSDDSVALIEDDVEMVVESSVLENPEIEAADNEQWAVSGGWYRDGSTIRYRPSNHADPFLRSWLELSSIRPQSDVSTIFKELSADDSVGACAKCHTLDSGKFEEFELSKAKLWKSFRPHSIEADFNRFSHVSHFSLMNDDGCSSCHLLNEAQENSTSRHGTTFTASFMTMDRQTCTQCHQAGRAPDNCLTCHNYHVETAIELTLTSQINDSFVVEQENE